jgi:hypothetical protein
MGLEILFGVGTLILLAALIYGTVYWSSRDKRLDRVTEAATLREREQEKRADKDIPSPIR